MGVIADAVVNISAKGTEQTTTALKGVSGAFGAIPGFAALAGGAVVTGVAAMGAASVKMAADFQESMTQLVTGAGESKSNLGLVSAGILQMARDTGTSTDQLAQGMYMVESAGYHGKAGLDVLKAAAEGAKVGNADLGTVADATTTILNDFGATGLTAAQAVNGLVATVAQGKTHMQDLAGAMANVLPTASAYKVHLNDVEGALSTMTAAGVPAADAATYLRQTLIGLGSPTSAAAKALKEVGLTTAQVNDEMKKSLPDTLAMITEAVGKKFPAGSVQYNEAIKAIAGGSKQMQGMLDLTGTHLSTFQADVKNVAASVTQGGQSITGWSEVQGDFNTKVSRAKEVVETLGISIGTKLLPFLGKMVDGATYAATHFDEFKPVILGVTAAVGVLAVVAGIGAVAMIGLTWPVLAVAAGIGLLTAGVIYAYQHWALFREAVQIAGEEIQGIAGWVAGAIGWVQKMANAVHVLGNVFSDVGTLIHDVFTGDWLALKGDVEHIQRDWNSDMKTLANQAAADAKASADKEALDVQTAALKKKQGVLQAAAQEADGKAKSAKAEYDYDIKTANASKDAATKAYFLKAAGVAQAQMQEQQAVANSARAEAQQVGQQMTAMKNNAVGQAQQTAQGVLTHMTNMTGGSIQQSHLLRSTVTADIASMKNDGISEALQLGAGVKGALASLAASSGQWGTELADNFAAGIAAGEGTAAIAANRIAMKVAATLAHSKPKEGPLVDDDVWGLHLVQNLANGMTAGAGLVEQAARTVAAKAAGPLGVGRGSRGASSGLGIGLGALPAGGALGPLPGAGAGAQSVTIVVQPPAVTLDGRALTAGIVPHLPRQFAIATGDRSH